MDPIAKVVRAAPVPASAQGDRVVWALLRSIATTWTCAGEKATAQQMIDRLFTLYPAWRISPRGEIERYVMVSEIVDRIMRDLSPFGFSTTN